MENNQKGLSFSINEDTIKYFRNKKKYAKNVKIMMAVLVASGLLTAGSLWGLVALGTDIMVGLTTFFGVTTICNGFGLSFLKYEKNECDKYWNQLMVDIQSMYGSERRIDSRSFRIFKGSQRRKLKDYTSEREIHKVNEDGELVCNKQLYKNDMQVGTVTRQHIIADRKGVLGALEEIEHHVVNRYITETGSREDVKVKYTYRFVPENEIGKYDSRKLRDIQPKGRGRGLTRR